MSESFEAMALRVAEEVYGAPVVDYAREQFLDFATRIRDELCKGQEPVACDLASTFGKLCQCEKQPLYLHPAPPPADIDCNPQTVLRLITTIKYMVGIAERGRGYKCPDDVLPERFLLDYVISLEALRRMRDRIERLRGALKTASGRFFAADDLQSADDCLEWAGDMEPPRREEMSDKEMMDDILKRKAEEDQVEALRRERDDLKDQITEVPTLMRKRDAMTAERDAAKSFAIMYSEEAAKAQAREQQLREALEYIRKELDKGNGICEEVFEDALAVPTNTSELEKKK